MTRPDKHPPVRLSLHLQIDPKSRPPEVDRRQIRRWLLASLEQSAELTLRFVARPEARALNRQFRGLDHATNVLTFNYPSAQTIQADIVICMAVLAREASIQHKRLRDHLAHLIIHGALHAQGWDHQAKRDASRMEAREIYLLKRFHIGDPYQLQTSGK